MNNCVIDWGNTLIKAGIFADGKLINSHVAWDANELVDLLDHEVVDRLILSSVSHDPQPLLARLSATAKKILLDASTPLPFNNHYLTKDTLGNDRKAAVAGAQILFPGKSCLVIDIGTCITYDYIENGLDYRGGMISPGVRMRLNAMHQFTGRLPQIETISEVPEWEGLTTKASMLGGVIHGVNAEINELVSGFNSKKGDLQVILTGGDQLFFESRLKEGIFVAPEIVLIGLNAILEFNEK